MTVSQKPAEAYTPDPEDVALPGTDVVEQTSDLKPGRAYEGETDAAKEERTKAVTTAYSKATTALREQHLSEFNGLVTKFAAEAGYDWQPKPTKTEKARAALAQLLADNPELADEVKA